MQYFKGVGNNASDYGPALVIGVLLGVLVSVIRTSHDQQRPGRRNLLLGFVNGICKVYVTVIRGTPMMVQLLIMGLVIFEQPQLCPGGRADSGHQLRRRHVAEIIRGGLMSLDPGQSEAGRSTGLSYIDTMRFIVIPQAFKAILPALGNEFIVPAEGYLADCHDRRQGATVCGAGDLQPHLRSHVPAAGRRPDLSDLVMIFSAAGQSWRGRLRQSDRR